MVKLNILIVTYCRVLRNGSHSILVISQSYLLSYQSVIDIDFTFCTPMSATTKLEYHNNNNNSNNNTKMPIGKAITIISSPSSTITSKKKANIKYSHGNVHAIQINLYINARTAFTNSQFDGRRKKKKSTHHYWLWN